MIRARNSSLLLCASLAAGFGLFSPALAQDDGDPLALMAEAEALCAADVDSIACAMATDRSAALMAMVIAEAGNTGDRGEFIGLVRLLLTDEYPEIRTSAAYALAKLQPDASDTPAIVALLRDPVSNVRAGAWAAAWMSVDPAARLVARRVPLRPSRAGYAPADATRDFDPAALGFALPEGAEYLRLTEDRRKESQLEFLTPMPQAAVLDWAASLAAGAPVPPTELLATDLLAIDPATVSLVLAFLDAKVFGDPQVLRLPPEGGRPLRLVVVYRDILFDQTGIAVIFDEKRDLRLPELAAKVVLPDPELPLDGAAFIDAALRASGFKPDAPKEESDLFLSVVAAYGFGAEDYLELYPDGAYVAEARAIVAGPRLTLDALRYDEGSDLKISFQNLPPESSATVEVAELAAGYAIVAGSYIPQVSTGETLIQTAGAFRPGVYLVTAIVTLGDGSGEIILNRDFSVARAETVLTLDKAEYAPGAAITITFSGMSGDDQDYVATADQGSPNSSYLQYVYTQGERDGVATLTAPMAAGQFEVRAFFREDESDLRGSVAFSVPSAAVAPTGSTLPSPGQPTAEARAILTPDKLEYAPAETIMITYSDMFGDRQDYIAISPAGSPNTSYLQYVYTGGALAGTTTLTAPTTPGVYELRAFFKEDETILRASVTFSVY